MTLVSKDRPRHGTGRVIAINVAVLIAILAIIEGAARALVWYTRGSATAGLQERTLNLEYEPFVMFGPGWDARFLEFRPAAGTPVVLLIGGSTAQNFAPEILEAAIARRFGRPVRVMNASFGGYEARQEAIVAALWAPRLAPVLVISLDGQNDLEHRLRVFQPGTFFLNDAYRAYLTRPAAAPLLWLLSHSQAYNGLVRLQARRQVGDWTRYADAIPVYLDAQHSINVLARGLPARRLMVLQPFMSFKEPLAPEERAFTAYAYRDEAMRALYDRTAPALADLARRDGVAFLDARSIYRGIASAVFTDDVHFRSAEGYTILARAIAEALPADALGDPERRE
jgi:lysophospholipase L1-like esterase